MSAEAINHTLASHSSFPPAPAEEAYGAHVRYLQQFVRYQRNSGNGAGVG